VHHRTAAVAAPDGYQAFRLKDPQRFAQGYQTDPESFDQDVLAGEKVTVGELAVENLPTQLLGHDLGRSTRGQSAAGLGADSDRSHSIPAANVESDAVLRRGRPC
jgi:2-oxoglutarate dehydrogenase complex dehydrogenase (E1) component-like enzyme